MTLKKNILHVIPSLVNDPKHLFLGITKDIRGRTEYFRKRKINFKELVVLNKSDDYLLNKLKNINLSEYNTIILEYPLYPRSLIYLKKNYPQIRLITRAHNSGFYQWLHYSLARLLQLKDFRFYNDLINSFKRLRLDYLSVKNSDYLLSISPWESVNYWRYLAPEEKIVNLPYFLPSSYISTVKRSTNKKFHCLCLMSTKISTAPFLLPGAYKFIGLVKKLGTELPDWSFYITGDFPFGNIKNPERIKLAGFIENPLKLLSSSLAIVLLSDYGFGFKTKLLDAVYYQNYLLLTQKIYQRLPPELRKVSLVVDTDSVDSFKRALAKCSGRYPQNDINNQYRNQNFQALDNIIS